MKRHPVEDILNATADDILTAIQYGFRAQVDVKGKLAELFMSRQFQTLKEAGEIEDYEWQDVDGKPDFIVKFRGHTLVVECKNIRNEIFKRPPSFKVELQRTRNSMDGTLTRGYKVDEFHVLGVALFNQTGKWDFLYVDTRRLETREDKVDFLKIMQKVPMQAGGQWRSNPIEAFMDAIGEDAENGEKDDTETDEKGTLFQD